MIQPPSSISAIKSIEKLKGELNGEFMAIWIATDLNNNLFMTYNLELKQVGDDVENDFETTKWTNISNEKYKQLSDELHSRGVTNYTKESDKTEKRQAQKSRFRNKL